MGLGNADHRVRHRTGQEAPKLFDRVQRIGSGKPVAYHSFQDSLATVPLEHGHNNRPSHELLGRLDVRSTIISTHVLNRQGRDLRSAVDVLGRRRLV